MHDAPDPPQVDRHRVRRSTLVQSARRHLGRRVLVRSARRVHQRHVPVGRVVDALGVAEIAQLDAPLAAPGLRLLGAHDVLRLDVAVADALLVHVPDRAEQLAHDRRHLALDEGLALCDVVHQLAAVEGL